MARPATKAADNVFYLARKAAEKCNDHLGSREGAAEETGIDRTRLARIEAGVLIPYPEEVLMMAHAYQAPQLCNPERRCNMKINTLRLENFQGIKAATFDFNGQNASIYGDNATGKTTAFNAVTWLLFDRPSTGAKGYTPKTKGPGGDMHYLDHAAEAQFVMRTMPRLPPRC